MADEKGIFDVLPDEGVSIEQQFHAALAQKASGNGLSKSSLVQNDPKCKPAVRETNGTSRAMGLLPSVRMISVPETSNESKSFRWACTSLKSILFVNIVSFPADHWLLQLQPTLI